jgi:imidazolonepropionase
MLPKVTDWYANSTFAAQQIPIFCDVFCEDHAFSPEQSWKILAAGQAAGLQPKIHVDQFNALYGVEMAIEIGAVSADHLDVTKKPAIRKLAHSDTICVPLPAVNYNLGHTQFANARAMIDAGCAVALATDLNPGSAPCYGMPFVMATACRYQRLLPSEALNASTINAAHAVGIGDRVGSLEVGKQADMLILKGADYRHASYFFGGNPIAQIVLRGKLYAP